MTKRIMTDEQKAEWRKLERALERASAAPQQALDDFLGQFDCEPQECEACGGVFDLEDCHMGDDAWFCKGCVADMEEAA